VARTTKRIAPFGVDSLSDEKDNFRCVTTGVAVTYGGVLNNGDGGDMGLLLPTMNAWLRLEKQSVRCMIMLQLGKDADSSCMGRDHLYRASPNARVGSSPPRTRPFRMTWSASSAGCSDCILKMASLLNSIKTLNTIRIPFLFIGVPSCLIFAQRLYSPLSFAILCWLPNPGNCSTVPSASDVQVTVSRIEHSHNCAAS
jgi:hypothetical protein